MLNNGAVGQAMAGESRVVKILRRTIILNKRQNPKSLRRKPATSGKNRR
ncbi:MAG: hypothetical protein LBU34_05110 [Planctomycetaceae bacterium]|nr:hypothetical protein [Planctomycetaceae bacterium]